MSNPLMTVDISDASLTRTEKNALISARIIYLAESRGITLAEAVDLVLGSGTVDALIDSVYRSFRAANGASVACGASEGQRQGD